jgi:hypothetical protein
VVGYDTMRYGMDGRGDGSRLAARTGLEMSRRTATSNTAFTLQVQRTQVNRTPVESHLVCMSVQPFLIQNLAG